MPVGHVCVSNPQIQSKLKTVTQKLRHGINDFERFHITQEDFGTIKTT